MARGTFSGGIGRRSVCQCAGGARSPERAEREPRPADRFPFRIDEADARQAQGERQTPCRRHHQQRQVRDELELLRRMRLRRAVRCAREGVRVDDDVTVHVVRVGNSVMQLQYPAKRVRSSAAPIFRPYPRMNRFVVRRKDTEFRRTSQRRTGHFVEIPPIGSFPKSLFRVLLSDAVFPDFLSRNLLRGAFGPFSALFSRFCG